MQSQLFHSSACYFEWKEPLSPLPVGCSGWVILRVKVQPGLSFCLVLAPARQLPRAWCFPLECLSWKVCLRHKEDSAGEGEHSRARSIGEPRGLHRFSEQHCVVLRLAPPVALVVWAGNYIEELHVCCLCLLLGLEMEEGREVCKLDGLMGKKVKSGNTPH